MAIQVGSGSQCQIGKESAYGTPVSATKAINFTSESVKLTVDKRDEGNLISSVSPTARDLMAAKVDGSVSFILRPDFAGFLFKAAFGGTDVITASSPVVGSTKHTIALAAANASLPSYTLIMDRKVSVKKYSGMKIDTLQLDAKAGDYVKGSFTIKAKDESTGTAASIAATSLMSYKCVGGTLTLAGTPYDINGATVKLNNKLQDVPQTYTSGLYNPEPIHGMREITLDFDIPYDTNIDTIRDTNLTTETKIATAVLTLISPSMITGTTPYKVVLTLNNVAITDVTSNVSGSGIITAKVSGIALAVGATAPATVDVYDDQSTAY